MREGNVFTSVCPLARGGYPPRPGQDGVPPTHTQEWGTPPPAPFQDRTAKGVLVTWQVVCLFCARRRTFLFLCVFEGIAHLQKKLQRL